MRKIETEMVAAIKAGKNFTRDNTSVVVHDGGLFYSVFLFGNHIAKGIVGNVPRYFNLCSHPSNTTMSRLRALGVPVCRKGGVPCLHGRGAVPVNVWVGSGKGFRTPLA